MPLDPSLSAKFANPVVRQAIVFYVMFVVNQMGQVKSEKVIKLSLLRKFKGRLSREGVEFIYELAKKEFYKSVSNQCDKDFIHATNK